MMEYPAQSPTIPATPAKTGGAGTGSLKKAKTAPAANPVSIDSNTSFITFHPLMEENLLVFHNFLVFVQ